MEVIGFTPRPSQREILSARDRFLIVNAGRRFGKTMLGLNWLLQGACQEGGTGCWTAPIFAQSKMAFRSLVSAANRGTAAPAFRDISQTELRIALVNNSVLHFRSADNPDSLRGEGYKRVVQDEAARQSRDTFEEVLRPTLSDTHGRLLALSTPKGKNHFFEMHSRGVDPLHPEYKSWTFPTSDNPKVPTEDIEQARMSLPVDVFEQEYLAKFLENQAGVFRNVAARIGAKPSAPVPGRTYVAGLDLARTTDFTVLSILDAETAAQVYLDRFNTLDWAIQKARIAAAVSQYNARVLVDATGVGDPIFEDLFRAGLDVAPYKFDAFSKKRLIEALMLGFDERRITLLDDPTQKNELESFEYEIGSSGMVRYSAPDGYHDDTVIALALAFWLIAGPRVEPKIRRLT